ncbi:MAG: peptide chain release factor N(5)-glutamine methyltransferase [Lachnospiraceae bacterium]|nr:peptide chain release factor N(5)-glutamine methyltransferase [Lachnospiraceae bacterium]
MTLDEAYRKGRAILEENGISDAANDAGLLLFDVCGIDKGYLLAHGNEEVNITCEDGRENRYFAMVSRRASHIPLQHILGYTCFMGLTFKVDNRVLVPRQDTEILVEEVLGHVHDGMRILDLCTGSGCILISLLNYSNDCFGIGTDISEDALLVAKENAKEILSGKEGTGFEFIKSDIFENVEGRFDIIVSNPPYIKSDVIKTLDIEVKDHDPYIALDGGKDGLIFYKRIIDEANEHLNIGGALFFEIGYDEAEPVSQMLKDKGFTEVKIIKDYAGLDRVVIGVRSCLTD